ncbi:unnamed protein product [Linum trigynum]|uniref:Uncharacterized protein n=1 Tax=Linum trigynum TaxID=586398 RepID=A0AAV2D975_9ROSI
MQSHTHHLLWDFTGKCPFRLLSIQLCTLSSSSSSSPMLARLNTSKQLLQKQSNAYTSDSVFLMPLHVSQALGLLVLFNQLCRRLSPAANVVFIVASTSLPDSLGEAKFADHWSDCARLMRNGGSSSIVVVLQKVRITLELLIRL